MSDTNSKVLFYPLERLDMVDLRGVQDLAHNAVSEYVGAVTTTKSGLVNAWSNLSIDNVNHRLEFADFTALGRTYPADANTSYYPAYLLKFNSQDSANGDCSFDNARAAVQAYFNSNGSLPPVPGNYAYSTAQHGQYYPYVYCRPVVASGETEIRRFWSLADAQETTDTVATRSVTSVEFEVVSPTAAPSAGGDFSWIRVAQLYTWTESGGVVSLSAVREQHLADRLLNLDDYRSVKEVDANAGIEDGLDRAVKYLQNRIEDLLTNGTDDPASATDYTNYARPRLSISGLDYELNRRATALEDHLLSGSFIITSTIDTGANTESVTVSSGAFASSPFIVNARRDYSLAVSDYRTSGLTPPIAMTDLTNPLRLAKAAYALLIYFPVSYAGYVAQVTVTPVAQVDYSSTMPGLSTALISSGSYHANIWHIIQEATTSQAITLSTQHNAIDENGDQITSVPGFRLVGSCAYGGELPATSHLPSQVDPVPLVYSLKVDITLINPLTYEGL